VPPIPTIALLLAAFVVVFVLAVAVEALKNTGAMDQWTYLYRTSHRYRAPVPVHGVQIFYVRASGGGAPVVTTRPKTHRGQLPFDQGGTRRGT
jgi:hypothetical protein